MCYIRFTKMKPFFTVERLKFLAIFYKQREFERQRFRIKN